MRVKVKEKKKEVREKKHMQGKRDTVLKEKE